MEIISFGKCETSILECSRCGCIFQFIIGDETFYARFYNGKPATSGYPKGATVEEILSVKCPCCGKVSPVNENDLPVGVQYKRYIHI